ncbi:MAG: Holliday junction resolvase RuvX [Candidatus Omnitrophica bacterium]|nr:Holliday junction resolvase RuvX [Candidatus Omnitrophota bacterium]
MRILGLDVGDRRIGVAVSDALGLTAQRVSVLERRGMSQDAEAVQALAEQYGASAIVVGLPLTMRGERGVQAGKVTAFAETLRRRVAVPVEFVDERLTTVQGARALRETGASRRARKAAIDQVAAQLILQDFLDRRRQSEPR